MAKMFNAVLALAMLTAATPALSEVLKQGPVDTRLCWGGPMHVISGTSTDRFGTYAVKGGTSADNTMFDSMILECIGTFETRSSGSRSNGHCVFQDASGDKIYGIDSMTPQGGYAWEYQGGTGKFEGISGSGRVERIGNLGAGPGTLQGCRRFVGNYTLP